MTHETARECRDHDERQQCHDLYPRIELLQEAVFLCQLLGIERVFKSINHGRKSALNHRSRFLSAACHGEVLGGAPPPRLSAIHAITRKEPRISPLPNTADIA